MKPALRRYIEVPAEALLAVIDRIGASVTERGGSIVRTDAAKPGNEIVFALRPPARKVEIRIYTSIAHGADAVRGCGEDAIRLVWGRRPTPGAQYARDPATAAAGKFKPLAPSRRVFRTAPSGLASVRLQAFLDRFQQAVRDVYGEAVKAPRCPACGCPQVERKGPRGPFMGCSDYPQCKESAPAVTATGRRVEPPKLQNGCGPSFPRGLPGHAVVAQYGLPQGEIAAQQVEDGLTAELDGSDYFSASQLVDALGRDIRRAKRGF